MKRYYKKWKKLLAIWMAAALVSGIGEIRMMADAAQGDEYKNAVSQEMGDVGFVTPEAKKAHRASRAIVQLTAHSRVSGAQWEPDMDLSDDYMRSKIDFYVQYQGDSANELVGAAYTIQWMEEDGTVLSGSPENAGNYTVKIILDNSLAGTAELVTDTFTFRISQMDLKYAILGLYGGKPGQPQWTGEPVLPEEPYVANSSYTLPEDCYELMFIEGKNCIEPGRAYVKAVGKGPNVKGEKEFQYQIIKKKLDRAYFAEEMTKSFVYDQTPKSPLLEGDYENISSTEYLYYFDELENRIEGAPIAAGSYSCMVRLIPEDTEHYSNETWMQEYTIAPRKLKVDVQVTKSKVYDGWPNVESPQAAIANQLAGDEVELSATAKYDDKRVGENKTITVSYRVSGKDAANYLAPEQTVFNDGEILPKEIKADNIVLQSYYYNGSREVPLDDTAVTDKNHWVLTGQNPMDDVAMDISEVRAFMEDADVGVNKPVTFSGFRLTGADSGNYTLKQPERTVTIRQIEFSNAFEVKMDSYQYGSAVPEPSLSLYKGNGQIIYKYRAADSGEAYQEWKDIGPETLKPGKYEMIAEVSDTVNYKGGTTVYPGKFDVSRFSPEIEGSTKWEKRYGDEPFYLDVTQKGDGELIYQLIQGADVIALGADGKITIKKAGEARIYVSASQTEYYEKEGIWIDISVLKIPKPDNMPMGEQTEIKAEQTMEKLGDIALPEGWSWKEPEKQLIPGGIFIAAAIYEDTDNYEQCQVQMEISKEAEIIASATDHVFTIGKDEKAVIKCTGALSELKDVKMDGVSVESANYMLQEGSTILIFPQAYLDKFSVGNYTVSLSYTVGEVETTLTVKKEQGGNGNETPPENTPSETGPENPPKNPSPENPPSETGPENPPKDNLPKKPPTDTSPKNPPKKLPTDTSPVTPPNDTSSENPSGSSLLGNNAQLTENTAPGTATAASATVKTGDDSLFGWYAVLLLSSMAVMILVVWRRKKSFWANAD